MTIKELIEHQNNNSVVCFIRQGLFYRAYNQDMVLTSVGIMSGNLAISYVEWWKLFESNK